MIPRWSVGVRLFPIIFFIAYLNLTVFLFAFGPWPYPVRDGTKLYAFLASAHLALLGGYLTAVFRRPHGYLGPLSVWRLLALSIAINLALLIPTSAYRTGRILPHISGALSDLGAAYYDTRVAREGTTPTVEYVRAFFGPFLSILVPLAVFYWEKWSSVIKWLAVLSILGNLATGVAMGVNRELFMLLFLAVWCYIASHLSKVGRIRWERIIKYFFVGTIALMVFLFFFSKSMVARKSTARAHYFTPLGIYADQDNFLIRGLSGEAAVGVLGVTGYLTQGYYALHLSLEKPFLPMFGVGHSMFVTRQAARIAGLDELARRSYPDRIMIQDGWDSYGNYTTIYPWLASDLSFPGTIVVMLLLGRMFALTWVDTLKGHNPFAVALFSQLSVLLVTVPTVNWIVNNGEGFFSFWVIFAMWALTRRRYTCSKDGS